MTISRPRSSSGSSGSGGIRISRIAVVTSSGAPAAHSVQAVSTRSACDRSHIMIPAWTSVIGNSLNSIAVTMPKLPPPPRSAQNSSGSFSRSVRTSVPSAVTSSIAVTLFVWRPWLRASQPMPPPSE